MCVVASIIMYYSVGIEMRHTLGWESGWTLGTLIVIALVCGIIGTLGDLFESMFKRYCGIKDSGNIMPGHGGILDRFDSILASITFIFSFFISTFI